MNSLIRILFAFLLLTLIFINNSFAGNGILRPLGHLSGNFAGTIQKIDSFLSASLVVSDLSPARKDQDNKISETASSRGRICSCQILNLESSNYNHRHIAVFAEKTNHGSSSDFNAAKNRINKEKKQLKRLFYDKVEVVAEVSEVGTCQSMYVRLKSKDEHLQVYEILNADIR